VFGSQASFWIDSRPQNAVDRVEIASHPLHLFLCALW
jgi:hypothetical protein